MISLDHIESMHYWEGYRRSKVPFSVHLNKGYTMSECNTGDVNRDQLAQMLSARILYYKFTIFPFVIVKYFRRNTLRLCLNFYSLVLASIDFSSLWQLLLWISNGDFYICSFLLRLLIVFLLVGIVAPFPHYKFVSQF